MKEKLQSPIDAVITWVDGTDKLQKAKMNPYIKDSKLLDNDDFRTRFDQVEEVKIAVDSILKFAPYIRNIFIVTDNQIPVFLKTKNLKKNYSKVSIIDHKQIFKGYEEYLPTFNSLSIETMLFRIPNLSEHFIYFNDDFFLIKETKPSCFFKNISPILRGEWRHYDSEILHKKLYAKFFKLIGKKSKKETFGFKMGQQNITRKLEFKKYFKFDHTPAPMRISTLENYFIDNPEMLLLNIKHKFRHPEQYTIQSLANHLEIKSKTCELKYNYQLAYFGSYKKPFFWYKFVLWYSNKQKNKLFLCMQSLNQCPKNKLNYFNNWFANTLKI